MRLVYSTDGAGPVLEAEHPLGEDCGIIGISPMDGRACLSCLDENGLRRQAARAHRRTQRPFPAPPPWAMPQGRGNSILALGAFSLYSLDPVAASPKSSATTLNSASPRVPRPSMTTAASSSPIMTWMQAGRRWSLVTPQEGVQPAVKYALPSAILTRIQARIISTTSPPSSTASTPASASSSWTTPHTTRPRTSLPVQLPSRRTCTAATARTYSCSME